MNKTNSNRSNLEFKVNAMKVADLKRELKQLGFDTGGLKKDLRSRLLQAMIDSGYASEALAVPAAKSLDIETSSHPVKPSSSRAFNLVDPTDAFKPPQSEVKVDSFLENGQSSLQSGVIPPKCQKDSISSMQVEHHMTETTTEMSLAHPKDANLESDDLKENSPLQIKESKSEFIAQVGLKASNAPTMNVSSHDVSLIGKQGRVSDVEMPPANATEPARKSKIQQIEESLIVQDKKVNEELHDISPPASEASSASSKSSGKMVKDMVSKFSGLTSLSSTSSSSGSALSKGLQAKKDARLARMAEIREKVRTFESNPRAMCDRSFIHTVF
jgi:SAP domain